MKKKGKLWTAFLLMFMLCLPSFCVNAATGGPSIVTSYTMQLYYDKEVNRYLTSGIFEVDGIMAFCIQRDVDSPEVGTETSVWYAVTNEKLRKVLYYGYNGPENKGYTFMETALAAAEANDAGDRLSTIGDRVLEEIMQYDVPPEEFHVWRVETEPGKTQDLAFYTMEERVLKVTVQKVNEIGESLPAAEFTIYADEACTQEVTKGETDEQGVLTFVGLKTKTNYYLKETKAPEGYQASDAVYRLYSDGSQEQSLIQQVVVNSRADQKLPNTGSVGMPVMGILGVSCLALSIMKKEKKDEK